MKSPLTKPRIPHEQEMEERRERQLERQPSHEGDIANQVVVRKGDFLVGSGKYNSQNTRGKR
jgi:hypothetical protein